VDFYFADVRVQKLAANMWATATAIPSAILLLSAIVTAGQEISAPKRLFTRPAFYSDTNDGDIAFLPDSNQEGQARYMTSFWAMQEGKYYELPSRGNYGFVANIRDKTGTRKKPSFLAVTVVQIQDANNTSGAWLRLTRTDNFIRENDSTFKEDPKEFQDGKVTFSDLRKWHTTLKTMSAFDLALQHQSTMTFTWHARPLDGTTSSWDFRFKLFGALSDSELADLLPIWFRDLPQDYKVRIQTHLLRFTPANGSVPIKPMDFYFNNCGARKAVIITTCPDYPTYASFVFLKLKP